ncbi:breast cancer anti-estrogen resistance protein 3 homolog isoform X4 [Tribolium castaneum]|uniref:breast cancer anti-estrogen resistance protein 3 homolog isoform X4 n=1 Tax=Tribolium castaneum TaxID=7070 RepID=UPI00046C1D08|nr:PREDICTED: breast cancer anti-estrogen resistance protein 3 isoform X2 [Tribolium castaneum]XP_008200899.1 PREDICTED: breast cancer anti-estrogen resistance protein 3 isoform X2 [Tribolium castaneum]XP_008200939.1 PREDICTED: breast cancer anti-estrogen resistance protein 3 isoform X2 [Tribolium castaneum]XP_008200984.1 PREDICTED: breast cancer anti-estrogen resistance protein 3 isoform X2 [Tribolium castaneum]|eukprot:XP_008200850.1 PREDICTED: breast cancer anti-estrogen resistance protein 3 isoform X2 [Tribolium castaneum]
MRVQPGKVKHVDVKRVLCVYSTGRMGKSASKLKKRKETKLSWTQRFGSLPLRSKSRINKANNVSFSDSKNAKHIDITQWLKRMELGQYESLFQKFNGVEDLLEFSEADLKDLGVKISSHRAMIISSLTILRAKYHGNFRRQPSIRHSVAVDKTITIEETDKLSNLSSVYEPVQSKSLNNLIMEPTADPSMNSLELKKALEWELSLDSRDLRSHAWYHGAIPRSRAEDIVREEGGFLVRDCTSQPGNYVLTCRTKTQPLHFVINKIILQPDTVYEHVQFQFEEDAFDTVPDLITFYVGSGKPITAASGARIQFPKNRMYPLSFYAAKYPTPLPQSRLSSPATTPIGGMGMGYRHSPLHPTRPSSSPTRSTREAPPRLPNKKQRSQSLTPSEVNRISQEKCNSADGVIQSPLMTRSAGADLINSGLKFSTHSLPRSPNTKLSLSASSNTLGRNCRITSDPTLSPCAEKKFFNESDSGISDSPPPKPSRVPSIIRLESKESDSSDGKISEFLPHGNLQRVTSYHASGSDSGNGSGDSALSSAAGDAIESNQRNSGVVIKNPRYNIVTSESSTTLKNFEIDYAEAEEKLLKMIQPEINLGSRFDLENFHTLLLPVNENKPLDTQALRGVKMMLQESGPRILANHLTRTDLDVIFHKPKDAVQARLASGIELCALPHGHQFRVDLIERTECLKLLVAVTILTCTEEFERTEMLNKWIEVAIDTKTALGNLFGFCGIMLGLCLPQVEKLDTTWHMLRQKYTDSAFNFEAKLRPTLKNMNSCSNPQAPNTTIPHLLPLILLHERTLDDFITPTEHNQLTTSCLGLWESNTQDFGLTTLLNHLETARKYMDSSASYQRNAEIVLGEARMEELTLDMFRTEFQMKFLWGSRGTFVPADERHSKFEQVLSAIADKYCSLRDDAEV